PHVARRPLGLAPRRGWFRRQCGTARAFLVERLTMLRRACGPLLSRGRGLLRECRRFLALLVERLCAVRSFRLPELPCFLARLAQLRRLRLDFALRRGEFARQGGTARAFLVERLTMLRRACGQLLSFGCGLLRKCRRFLALLLARSCAVRCFRLPQLT